MTIPMNDHLDIDEALALALRGILAQVASGMNFENAKGTFLHIAVLFGYSLKAPKVTNGIYALYLAWRERALNEIDATCGEVKDLPL